MAWKDRLVDASFRGVPFKTEDESLTAGRRVETHEFVNRDKPYTEDLGKATSRPKFSGYVIGDDCYEQRDRLIEALNKPGPGTLVHPAYGEMSVCVDGEINVSTSSSEGRMVRFDLRFVEAGELTYPTSGAATANTLVSSCSALDDCISDNFEKFGMDGVFIASSDLINPILDDATVAAAHAHIEPLAPVAGSDLYVFKGTPKTVNYTIDLTPDTPEIRAAVEAELRSFLLRDGYPEGTLELSRTNEAISIAAGEHSHKLLSPTVDTPVAKNELAVLGVITWA